MSSIQNKHAKLINALVKEDQRGKLTWFPFEGKDGCVFTEIGDALVYLDNHTSGGTESIKMDVYSNGKLASTFLDDDLYSSDVPSVTNETWFVTMTNLLEAARRKSTGADEVFDNLLKFLGEP